MCGVDTTPATPEPPYRLDEVAWKWGMEFMAETEKTPPVYNTPGVPADREVELVPAPPHYC